MAAAGSDTKVIVSVLLPCAVIAEKPARLGDTAIRRQDLDTGAFVAIRSVDDTCLGASGAR